MERIRIGICIPGDRVEEKLPWAIASGFESIAISFKAHNVPKDLISLARQIRDWIGDADVTVSGLGCYGNPLVSQADLQALERVISAAREFGTDTVGAFAGALPGRTVEEALPEFQRVFSEVEKRVTEQGLRLAFENCLQGGSWNCTTKNIAFHPRAWEMMFEAVPSDSFGLEWEPANQIAQLIDPIEQLKQWAPRVFHIHGKDGRVDWQGIRRFGVRGSEYIAGFRNPGRGETDFRTVFQILRKNGYQGSISLESGHDPAYQGERQPFGDLQSLDYLRWCRRSAEDAPLA